MKPDLSAPRFWKVLFFLLPVAYCLYYAPFGINETDGGFLTGLAWQLQGGKTLYADIVYVRPPLPVWLRALELQLLPANWAVLGERWIFYAKMALLSWLAAAAISWETRRWILAALGFVVSVHCYPAAAWHTVDGLLFGALALWSWTDDRNPDMSFLSGVSMALCLLCKQSFYPMALVWVILVVRVRTNYGRPAWALGAFLSVCLVWLAELAVSGSLFPYFGLTGSASAIGEFLQHGFLDYFRIQPLLAGASAIALAPVLWWLRTGRQASLALAGWIAWCALLPAAYGWALYQRQEFTVPFGPSRLLFDVALAWSAWQTYQKRWPVSFAWRFFPLLALAWCGSLSWGYNLPVLLSVPAIFVAIDISQNIWSAARGRLPAAGWSLALLLALLFTFRYGYEYVYRDGRRSAMTEPLGAIFPALGGIYSSPQKAELYRDLKELAQRYGPNVKTLPAFPQANFLTQTPPPLPLDWVVEREMQSARPRVEQALAAQKPVLLIEKAYFERLKNDPELALTAEQFRKGKVLKETPFFWVLQVVE